MYELHFEDHVTVFDRCQQAFTVLQTQILDYPSHVVCLLQFKFLQLFKFNLPIFQCMNYILKITWLFLTSVILHLPRCQLKKLYF